jgi:hypothetical protein
MKAISCLGVALVLLTLPAAAEDGKWTIHEWGTFTSLQNESGDTLGGINTDDEPVPDFVHRIGHNLVQSTGQAPNFFSKGVAPCHPDISMRLETPVIYFHPPTTQTKADAVSVSVKFRGGWLTEFFPKAEPTAPGLIISRNPTTDEFSYNPFAALHSHMESKLEWDHLEIGGAARNLPNTTEHVWTSPRAVQTAPILAKNGEGEKFIFYRGIAHIDAPLKISHDTNSGELLFRSYLPEVHTAKPLAVRALWLVDIRKNGTLAFRSLPSLSLDSNSKKILAHTSPEFASGDFSSGNLAKLRASLQSALVADGLFNDEAVGLLNTWEASYFKSPGLRVFFLVPREWTDFYLPLETSLAANINRVMVGRIELVTPEQRKTLATISRFSPSRIQNDAHSMQVDFSASAMVHSNDKWHDVATGNKPLSSAISVPSTYQAYLDLGRFRNALILDEAKCHPTVGLTNFIATYGLGSFKPVETLTAKSN